MFIFIKIFGWINLLIIKELLLMLLLRYVLLMVIILKLDSFVVMMLIFDSKLYILFCVIFNVFSFVGLGLF